MQMQGFGQQSLLTAAEEKVLSNAVQRLIALEAVQAEAVERLGRPVTEKEWMAECGQTSIHAFRKAIKVSFRSISTSPVIDRISWHSHVLNAYVYGCWDSLVVFQGKVIAFPRRISLQGICNVWRRAPLTCCALCPAGRQ